MHLLLAAGAVEVDDANVARIVKIAFPRIDKRQVSVLPDAEAAQVQRMGQQQRGVAGTRSLGITEPFDIHAARRQRFERTTAADL